jgi:hypothetical protein
MNPRQFVKKRPKKIFHISREDVAKAVRNYFRTGGKITELEMAPGQDIANSPNGHNYFGSADAFLSGN